MFKSESGRRLGYPAPVIRAKSFDGKECDWQNPQSGCVWVDAQGLNEPDEPGSDHKQGDQLAALKARFAMHPLALEDALEHGHWSRYEQYPAHEFITFRTLVKPNGDEEFTERLSLFLFPGVLLTISREGVSYLDEVWELVGRESVNTSLEVAYELLDEGAQTFFRYISAFENGLDEAEEEIFAQKRRQDAQTVFERKHRLAQVRSLSTEALSAVSLLNRHMNLENADQIRFRDVLDSMSRATLRLDGLRDSLRGLLDLHLSLQNQRMNEVMKTLTAVSTVFLPLTFLAGVWGMNFQYIPELHWRYGYLVAWASFIATAVGLAVYFKRRQWW
jgi:magnesium transporter